MFICGWKGRLVRCKEDLWEEIIKGYEVILDYMDVFIILIFVMVL